MPGLGHLILYTTGAIAGAAGTIAFATGAGFVAGKKSAEAIVNVFSRKKKEKPIVVDVDFEVVDDS